MKLLILLQIFLIAEGQENNQRLKDFLGQRMTDHDWRKVYFELRKQSLICKTGNRKAENIKIKPIPIVEMDQFFGSFHEDFSAYLAGLLKGQDVLKNSTYYLIKNQQSGNFLTTSYGIKLAALHGNDSQKWKVEYGKIIPKSHWYAVMTIDVDDYTQYKWAGVYLTDYNFHKYQTWRIKNRQIISNYQDLRLELRSDGRVGVYPDNGGYDNQKWIFIPEVTSVAEKYKPEMFADFMRERMSDDSWFTLLSTLDDLERQCRINFFGAYHIDFPRILNMTLEETTLFYLKKAQLYQGTPKSTLKGPIATFMSSVIDGRGWGEILLYLNQLENSCRKVLSTAIDRTEFGVYLTKQANMTKFEELGKYFSNEITRWWTESLESADDLGRFINQNMAENGWIKLIQDVKKLSDHACTDKIADFQKFNWAFHAGITNEPVKAFQMFAYISQVIHEDPINFI